MTNRALRLAAAESLLASSLVLGCGFWSCSKSPSTGAPANAVLIILDTTRADALSCYGGPARTPAMDGLAATGCLFNEALTQNPFTLGSIATILTSLPPDIHGIKGHGGFVLDPAAVTLAETFKASGYATASFVSAFVIAGETGLAQGFDVYDDDFSMDYPAFDPEYAPMAVNRVGAERRGNVTMDRALAWLRWARPPDAPFFLMVHLFDPHHPYDPPPPFNARYASNPYAGEVAFADSLIHTLLVALTDDGLLGSTVITVVADHGEAFMEHDEMGHGFFLYQPTLRVPWIISGPGISKTQVPEPVSLVHLAPTLLGACGLPIPEAHRGRNLLEDDTPEDNIIPGPEAVYAETYYPRVTHEWSELLAWREGAFKYIQGPKAELYNLDRDPRERHNLLTQEPATAKALQTAMESYLEGNRHLRLAAAASAPNAEGRERLHHLGYVGGGLRPAQDYDRPGWELGLPDPKDRIAAWNRRQETQGMLRKARSLAMQGRDGEAQLEYRRVLELDPESVDAWTGLAECLMGGGDALAAEAALRRALALDPDSPETSRNLAVYLARSGRFSEALPYYRRILDTTPHNAPVRIDLARIHIALGERTRAVTLLEEGMAMDANQGDTLLLLSKLRFEDGRMEEGKELLRHFLKLYPERPEAPTLTVFLTDNP